MPTTSNFGWTTPADTDLVKDGAAAIRTLGNGIDTSFLDLKGGTTDQVLAKNSNTDLDFKWVTSDDANAIQNAIVDAKGDLISATAADTPARLAVGANGTVLTADSGETTGLKWASPSSALTPYCSVYRSTSLNLTNSTYTELIFNSEWFDSNSAFNTTTGRFTPATAGKYFVISTLVYDAGGIDRWHTGYVDIRKNGTSVSATRSDGYDNYSMYAVEISNSAIVECNGTTDYISIFYYSLITTGTMKIETGSSLTIFKVA